MMGASLPPSEVWRPVSLEGIQHALGIIQALSDPTKAEALLAKIAEAQAGFDDRVKQIADAQAAADQRAHDVAALERAAADAKLALDGEWANLRAERAAFDANKAESNENILARTAVLDKALARQDARDKSLSEQSLKLTRSGIELDKRETSLNGREAAVTAREAAAIEKETALAEKHARLAAVLGS